MATCLGLDIGTTTITALAIRDPDATVAAVETRPTPPRLPAADGRFEWDAEAIAGAAEDCLAAVVRRLTGNDLDVAALGVTGQQHGVVVVDAALRPLTPFVNWQDRRGDEPGGAGRTVLDDAVDRLGPEAWRRAGCSLATGHLGLTLHWMQLGGVLPVGTAISIMEFVTARIAGIRPVTEPTCAAASGLFDVHTRGWDTAAFERLSLPAGLFPEVREATTVVGRVAPAAADRTGIRAGVPLTAPLGDQQAGFVGSVADRRRSAHLNVGTGAQVSAYVDSCDFSPPLELRPFPVAGNLLTGAVLCGGWSYQVLEAFCRSVGRDVLGVATDVPVYDRLTALAASVPAGAEGVVCEPLFSGTRFDPSRRGSWRGLSAGTFTPAHLARALLEGMASEYADHLAVIREAMPQPPEWIVAAGNGLRENAVLQGAVATAAGLPLVLQRHREEAALGTALAAAVGAGWFASLDAASAAAQSA